MNKPLSKSKLMAYRQCPRRLWLEVHRPKLRADSAGTEASYAVGNQVGAIARRIYDPDGQGTFIDLDSESLSSCLARTPDLLKLGKPVFEAGFSAAGALALADVLLPIAGRGPRRWRMVEVKSSGSLKEDHRDDAAVQALVAQEAGVRLSGMAVAHIDTTWTYPGGGDYSGLLKEVDLTVEVLERGPEVKEWIQEAHTVARRRVEPRIPTGSQCNEPYACGFTSHCSSTEPQAEYPVSWLPRVSTKALKAFIAESGTIDLRGCKRNDLRRQSGSQDTRFSQPDPGDGCPG